MTTEYAEGKKAWSISDRSGKRFPYNEMLFEPGTKLWIHYSESDGEYNYVDHPQGKMKIPNGSRDPIALETVRDDPLMVEPDILVDEHGEYLVFTAMFGQNEYIGYQGY
jgi:hypothetical protein